MNQPATQSSIKAFLHLCFSRSIMQRAGITALIVGSILIAINHGDALINGTVDQIRIFKMVFTLFVPYLVSTISSASTILNMKKEGNG